MPRQEYAPASTIHGVYRKWIKAGVFAQAWQELLTYYDEQLGIDWKWQALDGAITKAPLGGEATGPSPVDRGKRGTKRSLLTDRRGAPLSLVVTAANTHDKTVALETLDEVKVERSEKLIYRLHHLCLDKGYDYADVIAGVLARDYILHLKKRGQEDKPIAWGEEASGAALGAPPQQGQSAAVAPAQTATNANPAQKTDETKVTLKPGEGVEVKMEMSKGAKARYEWTTAGGPVNHDTHVDNPNGGEHSYSKGQQVERDAGEITAFFDGWHGWFWRNRNSNDVTITLKTAGEYRAIKRM